MKRKPKMSETDVTHGCRNFIGPMSCQKRGEPLKLSKTIEIPSNYDASPVLFKLTEAKYDDTTKTDTAWMLSRLDLSMIKSGNVSPFPQEQVIPEWAAFNSFVSIDNKKVQQVGFLPVLPHLVTKYETVYKSVNNFLNILKQLKQNNMAIFCDEGVYHIAREILLKKPEEFKGLVLCLGSFHLIKTYLACNGKYLIRYGCRTIWTENRIFGPDVVESVLHGSDCERSMEGVLSLEECITSFQWVEFPRQNLDKYMMILGNINSMKQAVSQKNKEETTKFLGEFKMGIAC